MRGERLLHIVPSTVAETYKYPEVGYWRGCVMVDRVLCVSVMFERRWGGAKSYDAFGIGQERIFSHFG